LIAIGIDPDLHNTGIAVVDADSILAVGVAKISAKLKGDEAVVEMCEELARFFDFHPAFNHHAKIGVVEGQQLYRGKTKNPDSILRLAQVAGAAVGAVIRDFDYLQRMFFPRPVNWKGSVPKFIHQARTLMGFGIASERVGRDPKTMWARPAHLPLADCVLLTPVTKGQWKHVVDAIGLARWGLLKASGNPCA